MTINQGSKQKHLELHELQTNRDQILRIQLRKKHLI